MTNLLSSAAALNGRGPILDITYVRRAAVVAIFLSLKSYYIRNMFDVQHARRSIGWYLVAQEALYIPNSSWRRRRRNFM